MSMLKKLAVALVVSGEFFAGSVKGEVWKTPWTVRRDGNFIDPPGISSFTFTQDEFYVGDDDYAKEYVKHYGYSFNDFLKYDLNDKGCYKGNDWADAEAIRGAIDNDTLQMAGFAYLINNSKPEERTPVFFGAKHPYDPNYPEKVHSSMFATSEYDHTERQLVNACFAWRAFKERGFSWEYGLNLNNAQKPIALDLDALKAALGNDRYTLRVHTKAVPCGNCEDKNKNISCCQCYGDLLFDLRNVYLNIEISYSVQDRIPTYCGNRGGDPDFIFKLLAEYYKKIGYKNISNKSMIAIGLLLDDDSTFDEEENQKDDNDDLLYQPGQNPNVNINSCVFFGGKASSQEEWKEAMEKDRKEDMSNKLEESMNSICEYEEYEPDYSLKEEEKQKIKESHLHGFYSCFLKALVARTYMNRLKGSNKFDDLIIERAIKCHLMEIDGPSDEYEEEGEDEGNQKIIDDIIKRIKIKYIS